MLSRFFFSPWTTASLLYPDAQGTAELLGIVFWLFVIGLAFAWVISRVAWGLLLGSEEARATIGVETGIRIGWAVAYVAVAGLLGAYGAVLAFLFAKEPGWSAFLVVLPYLGVALVLLLFSYLAFKGAQGGAWA